MEEAEPKGEAVPAAPPSTPEVPDELVRLVAELEKIVPEYSNRTGQETSGTEHRAAVTSGPKYNKY